MGFLGISKGIFMASIGQIINQAFRRSISSLRSYFFVENDSPKPKSEKEKVLMFGWELPPFNSGGLGVACFEIARTLADRGVEITFVLPKNKKISAPFVKLLYAESENIRLRQVKTRLYPYARSLSRESDKFTDNRYDRELIKEVKRYGHQARSIARSEEFSVIHAHDWLSFPAGVEAKKVSGKPLVAHVHATEFDRSGENVDPEVFKIEKAGLHKADQIIAVSHLTKATLVKHYGITPSKITVAHNGISRREPEKKLETLFEPFKKNGHKVILFLGRLTMQKGPDYFLRAAQRVAQIYPKTIFVVAGTGDMERQIIEQGAALGISDKVFFTGFVKDEALNSIYSSADLFVMPSVSEPFGIVALEALVNKTPTIISKQSGASEVVDHALKVDFWDIDEMANKIYAVLSNPSLGECMKEHGQADAQKNTWDKTAEKCIGVYHELSSAK